jgi:PIN domain nuclease of toxin-antitoxin system
VKLLLDTHAFLWSVGDDPRLSATARRHIADPSNDLFISIASLWEATVKITIGKMRVPGDSVDYLLGRATQSGVTILPILPGHLQQLQRLPMLHRDPFDRILVAQSVVEKMPLVSVDAQLRPYRCAILW